MEKKKNRFNKAWMQEHVNDHWVHEAKRLGYRARAAFKLTEIDEQDRLIKPGQVIVDLGSAPGSWSQVAAAKLKGRGTVIALDVLPMDPVRRRRLHRRRFHDRRGAARRSKRGSRVAGSTLCYRTWPPI